MNCVPCPRCMRRRACGPRQAAAFLEEHCRAAMQQALAQAHQPGEGAAEISGGRAQPGGQT